MYIRKEYCWQCFGECFTVGRCATKFSIFFYDYNLLFFAIILFCSFFIES